MAEKTPIRFFELVASDDFIWNCDWRIFDGWSWWSNWIQDFAFQELGNVGAGGGLVGWFAFRMKARKRNMKKLLRGLLLFITADYTAFTGTIGTRECNISDLVCFDCKIQSIFVLAQINIFFGQEGLKLFRLTHIIVSLSNTDGMQERRTH